MSMLMISAVWRNNYRNLRVAFKQDVVAVHKYITTDNRSEIMAEYRPNYADWFGDVGGLCNELALIDGLDDAMFTAFEVWAEQDLAAAFLDGFVAAGVAVDDARDATGAFLDPVLRTSFEMWRGAHGIHASV